MKRLFSMTLVLVMIFSLFTIPAMAANVELIKNGGFESYAVGGEFPMNGNTNTSASSEAFLGRTNYGVPTIVDLATEGISGGNASGQALKMTRTAGKTSNNFYSLTN